MSKTFIQEPSRETPIIGNCDVVVAGGGIAGISAALSASRAGAKVLLLEQQYVLGGLATLGLVVYFLPLCDGNGKQVSYGIAEELLQLSVSLEGKHIVEEWKDNHASHRKLRLECEFNPHVFAIEAERLLIENNVTILFGSQVCNTIVEEGFIKAIIIETRSGRNAILVKSVVDATGDGSVCRLAGERTAVYMQKNILAAWYCASQNGLIKVHPLGACDNPETYKMHNESDDQRTRYTGLDFRELSLFTQDAHKALMADFLAKGKLSAEHQLSSIPSIPQIRMTRRLAGVTELDELDEYVVFEDSVGMIGNWKRRGPFYEIPFSCLHGSVIKNLITAGRCISVTDTMWDNTRVIPACAVTGEAAGLAAATCTDFSSISISHLQEQLHSRNIPIHANELK